MKKKKLVRGLSLGLSLSLVVGVALHYNGSTNASEVKKQAKKKVSTQNQELLDEIDALQSVVTKNGVTTFKVDNDGEILTLEVSGTANNRKMVQTSSANDEYLILEQKNDDVKISQGKVVKNEFVETGAQEFDNNEKLSDKEIEELQEAVETEEVEEVEKKGIFTAIKSQYKPKYSYKEKKNEINIACKLDKSKYVLNKSNLDDTANKAYYEYVYNVNKFKKDYKSNRRMAWTYIVSLSATIGMGLLVLSTLVLLIGVVAAVYMAVFFAIGAVGAAFNVGKLVLMYKTFMKKIEPRFLEMDKMNESLAECYSVLATYGTRVK